jgi:hypothetical protein
MCSAVTSSTTRRAVSDRILVMNVGLCTDGYPEGPRRRAGEPSL